MPKYLVTVMITNEPRQKEITVYAPTEDEALAKAEELVLRWEGVVEADATDAEEVG